MISNILQLQKGKGKKELKKILDSVSLTNNPHSKYLLFSAKHHMYLASEWMVDNRRKLLPIYKYRLNQWDRLYSIKTAKDLDMVIERNLKIIITLKDPSKNQPFTPYVLQYLANRLVNQFNQTIDKKYNAIQQQLEDDRRRKEEERVKKYKEEIANERAKYSYAPQECRFQGHISDSFQALAKGYEYRCNNPQSSCYENRCFGDIMNRGDVKDKVYREYLQHCPDFVGFTTTELQERKKRRDKKTQTFINGLLK